MTDPVTIAEGEIGVAEDTGRNDGERIAQYLLGPWHGRMPADRLPWCAAFVLWVFEQLGYSWGRERWAMRAVHRFEACATDWGWMLKPAQVQRGDVVFFPSRAGSDAGRGRHMAIVESFDHANAILRTIDGNLGNAVRRATRHTPGGSATFARVPWRATGNA